MTENGEIVALRNDIGTLRAQVQSLLQGGSDAAALKTGFEYLTRNLTKAENHFDAEIDRQRRDMEHLEAELEDARKEQRELKSSYDKLVAKGVGGAGAVMFIGALLGWLINTLRGH